MKKLKFSRAKNTLCGKILRRILGEECGAVAMEYIVIALLVAAAIVGLVMVFSGSLQSMLGQIIGVTQFKRRRRNAIQTKQILTTH